MTSLDSVSQLETKVQAHNIHLNQQNTIPIDPARLALSQEGLGLQRGALSASLLDSDDPSASEIDSAAMLALGRSAGDSVSLDAPSEEEANLKAPDVALPKRVVDQNPIAQEGAIKEHFPVLIDILNNVKPLLPERMKSMKCDLQQELGCLTLEQMVELAYISLLVQFSPNSAGLMIAAKIAEKLTDKPWQRMTEKKERVESYNQLNFFYQALGKSCGWDSVKLNSLGLQLKSLEALSELFGTERFKEPCIKNSSKDRRVAINYFHAMIRVLADIVLPICKTTSIELQRSITERDKEYRAIARGMHEKFKSAKGAIAQFMEYIAEFNTAKFCTKLSTIVGLLPGQVNELRDAIPVLGSSKDPLDQFIQIKEFLTKGKNLRKAALRQFKQYQKEMIGAVGWFCHLAGMEDTISWIPQRIYEGTMNARIRFSQELRRDLLSFAEKNKNQLVQLNIDISFIFEFLRDYFSGNIQAKRESLIKKGLNPTILKELEKILELAGSRLTSQVFEVFKQCHREARPTQLSFKDDHLLDQCERTFLVKNFNLICQTNCNFNLSFHEGLLSVCDIIGEVFPKNMDPQKLSEFHRRSNEITKNMILNAAGMEGQQLLYSCETSYKRSVNFLESLGRVQSSMVLLSGSLFSMLEDAVYSSLNWREALDIEVCRAEAVNFDAAEFDNEDHKASAAQKSKKKKSKKAGAPKEPSTKAMARTIFVPMPSAAAKSMGSVSSTPLGQALFHLRNLLGVPMRITPIEVVGKRLAKTEAAVLDQMMSLHCVDVMAEMLQSSTASPATRHSVAGFLALLGNLAEERRETVDLLRKNPNAVLKHSLKDLRSKLGRDVKKHPVVMRLDKESLNYRYPTSVDNREKQLLEESPELILNLVTLMFESFSNSSDTDMQAIFKELSSLSETFGKGMKVGGALKSDQVQLLGALERQLKQTCEGVTKLLSAQPAGEKREFLTHIAKHLSTLSQIPNIIMHWPHQRYLVIPAMMLLISGQYAVENVYLYCAVKKGIKRVVLSKGAELHNLKSYEEYDPKVAVLDVGKGSEYVFEHCAKSSNDTLSDQVRLVSQLYEWSLVAGDNQSIWVPAGGKESPDKIFAEMQQRLINATNHICTLVAELVKSRVVD